MVYTQSLDEEFVILADTNIIGNIDFKEMFQYHLDTGSDITVAYTYRKPNVGESQIIFDENHKVYESLYHFDGSENICATQVKIYILTKELFNGIVKKGLTLGWEDILRDYIAKNLETLRVFAYQIKGYLKVVNNIKDYYDLNIPTIYGKNAAVKESILGDGSKINGTVENSIIFRDVVVEEGAVVRNSIILSDAIIKTGAHLDYVIADKGVVVKQHNVLTGTEEVQVVVDKGKTV